MAEGLLLTPNWNGGITENREFLTGMFTSRDGKEQRWARRNRPRITVDFTAMLRVEGLRQLEQVKTIGGEQKIGHFTHARRKLLYDASAGDTEILVDQLPTQNQVCLHRGTRIEFVEWVGSGTIEGFDEGFDEGYGPYGFRLILNAPLKQNWGRGTSVRPVLIGRASAETSLTLLSNTVATASIRFFPTPGDDVPQEAVTAYSPTIDGAEVFLLKPDWTTQPSVTMVTQFETVDYGVGIQQHYTPIDFSYRTTTLNFSELSSEKVMQAVGLFERMRGMAGEFYCPTWSSDLELAASASIGATALFVKDEGVARAFTGDTVRKAILVVFKNGTFLPLKLSSIASAGTPGQSRLNLSAALTTALSPGSIAMICWLPICRFATDVLTVQWITDEAARFTMSVRALETP